MVIHNNLHVFPMQRRRSHRLATPLILGPNSKSCLKVAAHTVLRYQFYGIYNAKEFIISLFGFQMQILLQTWPKLEPEQALELLDYTFADQAVRRIAVECIEKMR